MGEGVPTPARSGATLGAYDILRVLERGATETVYLAVRAGTDREVAIKVAAAGLALPPDLQQDGLALSKKLVHRHIARMLDSGEDGGLAYVVVERLQGSTLATLMADPNFRLEVPTAVDLIAQVCTGLHYAHERGLVHGDVTPANLFVTADNVAKVLNFGLTNTPATDRTVLSDNAQSGSFEYMSPEQVARQRTIDGRSDVFSAAVILYQLIAGRRPFDGPSPTATVQRILHDEPATLEVEPKLHAVIRRALEKQPEKRYNAQEFAYGLWMAHAPDGDVVVEDADEPPSVTLFVERADQPPAPEVKDAAPPAPAAPPMRAPLVYGAVAIAVTLVGAGVLLYAC